MQERIVHIKSPGGMDSISPEVYGKLQKQWDLLAQRVEAQVGLQGNSGSCSRKSEQLHWMQWVEKGDGEQAWITTFAQVCQEVTKAKAAEFFSPARPTIPKSVDPTVRAVIYLDRYETYPADKPGEKRPVELKELAEMIAKDLNTPHPDLCHVFWKGPSVGGDLEEVDVQHGGKIEPISL